MSKQNPLSHAEYYQLRKNYCESCGDTHTRDDNGFIIRRTRLTTHHIDHNHNNNKVDNLITLCQGCHNKVHANE